MATKKRKLSEIDFSADGAHVALTSKSQGYSANGKPLALVMKARSKELIEKVQQIQVTMELPDFLRKFYGLYWEDAEVLARVLGYVPPEKEKEEEDEWSYDDWIQEKVEGYVVIKSLKESEDLSSQIASLSDDDYLKLVQAQKTLEPLLVSKAADSSATDDKTSIGTEVKDEVVTSVQKMKKEENMPANTPEMVEKSALVALQKSLEDAKVELQKAKDEAAALLAEKKEAIVKSKTAAVADLVDAKHKDIIVKAALALETDEDFDAFVLALKDTKEVIEKSALFSETGASGDAVEDKKVNGVRSLIEKQFAAK
jgi:hypothetical protein